MSGRTKWRLSLKSPPGLWNFVTLPFKGERQRKTRGNHRAKNKNKLKSNFHFKRKICLSYLMSYFFCWNLVKTLLLLSRVQLCVTPWTATGQASLSFIISQSLLKLMSIESVMPSNHLILYHPLLLLPSIFLSVRVFSNELALCIRWSNYWNFSFSIGPSNEYSGLISFRMDWFDLLAVLGTRLFSAQPSLWSNSHICTWLLENHSFDYTDLC